MISIISRAVVLIIWLSISFFSCADEEEKIDCSKSELFIEVIKIKYSDCGIDNGEITVEASGGKAPYKFTLDEGQPQPSSIFINVKSGFREISVIDANKCSNSVRTFMSNKDPFQVVIYTTPSGCEDNKGTITVTPLGGVAPYKYQLGENNDNYQTSNIWENLRSGRHSIWVEDANKCFFGVYTLIPSGVSYSQQVASIIETKCTTPCHGGTTQPDFRNFSTIKANATKIKNMVKDRSMPPEAVLLTEEINLIKCWVDDGAANN